MMSDGLAAADGGTRRSTPWTSARSWQPASRPFRKTAACRSSDSGRRSSGRDARWEALVAAMLAEGSATYGNEGGAAASVRIDLAQDRRQDLRDAREGSAGGEAAGAPRRGAGRGRYGRRFDPATAGSRRSGCRCAATTPGVARARHERQRRSSRGGDDVAARTRTGRFRRIADSAADAPVRCDRLSTVTGSGIACAGPFGIAHWSRRHRRGLRGRCRPRARPTLHRPRPRT